MGSTCRGTSIRPEGASTLRASRTSLWLGGIFKGTGSVRPSSAMESRVTRSKSRSAPSARLRKTPRRFQSSHPRQAWPGGRPRRRDQKGGLGISNPAKQERSLPRLQAKCRLRPRLQCRQRARPSLPRSRASSLKLHQSETAWAARGSSLRTSPRPLPMLLRPSRCLRHRRFVDEKGKQQSAFLLTRTRAQRF